MDSHVKAVLIAAGLILAWMFSSLLLLVFTSIVFAVALDGMTSLMQKATGLSRKWSFPLVFVFWIVVIGLTAFLMGPSLSAEFQTFSERFPSQAQDTISSLNNMLGIDIPVNIEGFKAYIDPRVILRATQTVSDSFGVIADLFFLLVLPIYLAASPGDYNKVLKGLSEKSRNIVTKAHKDLKWWLVGRFASMFIIFILTTIGLFLLGMPFAIILGILAGLLSFIPNLGPILAAVPAVIVGFVQSPLMVVYVIILYVIVQIIESYFVTPQIDRKTVSIAPGIQLVSQLLFGAIFGFLGLVLAVPIAIVIRSSLDTEL